MERGIPQSRFPQQTLVPGPPGQAGNDAGATPGAHSSAAKPQVPLPIPPVPLQAGPVLF